MEHVKSEKLVRGIIIALQILHVINSIELAEYGSSPGQNDNEVSERHI